MEGATLRRFLCGNTCDNCAGKGEMGWDGSSIESQFWSSLHIFFKDPDLTKECPAEFGCVVNPLSRMDPPMKAICCPVHIFFKDPDLTKECPAEFGCVVNPLSRMDPPMKAICCPGFPQWNG